MEPRTITVVSSRTQTRTVLENCTADTLGELKAALREKNVNFAGLSFFEGISKTELTSDDAILPHGLPWKGGITNDLIFMLTESQKKIKNGAMLRHELYDFIKSNNLQEKVRKAYGKSYTCCTTEALQNFYGSCSTSTKRKPCKKHKAASKDDDCCGKLAQLLVKKGIITMSELVAGEPAECTCGKKLVSANPTDAEVKKLFAHLDD